MTSRHSGSNSSFEILNSFNYHLGYPAGLSGNIIVGFPVYHLVISFKPGEMTFGDSSLNQKNVSFQIFRLLQ